MLERYKKYRVLQVHICFEIRGLKLLENSMYIFLKAFKARKLENQIRATYDSRESLVSDVTYSVT